MKDLRAALMEKGFKDKKQEIIERDERNGAIDKDIVFKKAYEFDNNRYYQVKGTIDAFSTDVQDNSVRIVTINTIHIYIDGVHYIANHTHLRSDRVRLNNKWKKGQKITLYVKIQRYPHGLKEKYELINIF